MAVFAALTLWLGTTGTAAPRQLPRSSGVVPVERRAADPTTGGEPAVSTPLRVVLDEPVPYPSGTLRSACPDLEAVHAEYRTLVPDARPSETGAGPAAGALPGSTTAPPSAVVAPAGAEIPAAFPVEVADLGARYRVIVAGRRREYRDDRRDCADRARVAALFVALVMETSQGSTSAAVEPARRATVSSSPGPPAATAAPIAARNSRIEVGPSADLGLGTDRRANHLGAALRIALGAGSLLAVVAGVFVTPAASDSDVGGLTVNGWRLPVDLGLRLRRPGFHALEPYAEAGATAAWTVERGVTLADNARHTTTELGAYGLAGLRLFGAARLAPFVAVRVEWVPRPLSVEALPRGVVGHTPAVWIGATLGASLSL